MHDSVQIALRFHLFITWLLKTEQNFFACVLLLFVCFVYVYDKKARVC
jgi:hypothetical protein